MRAMQSGGQALDKVFGLDHMKGFSQLEISTITRIFILTCILLGFSSLSETIKQFELKA